MPAIPKGRHVVDAIDAATAWVSVLALSGVLVADVGHLLGIAFAVPKPVQVVYFTVNSHSVNSNRSRGKLKLADYHATA